ncbi:MAG: peptidoglycan DD-metalloendopeptidase family protein [Ruminococcus sp.]|nr:peptidoglycan DD-metalloendopeptidase family protein [Ruminococcus sp.]
MKFKKITAYIIAISLISSMAFSVDWNSNFEVFSSSAKLSEIESQRKANNAKIAEYEKRIEESKNQIANKKNEQKLLQDKIDLQNENLILLNDQIEVLDNEIVGKQYDIDQRSADIDRQQGIIDVGIEDFKTRLLAMYVSGSDSLAEVLVGATDFYDILSRIEIVKSISEHDHNMIENLNTQLEEIKKSKEELEIKNQELQEQRTIVEEKRVEAKTNLAGLAEDMGKLSDLIGEIDTDIKKFEGTQEELEAENKQLEKDEAKIRQEILDAQNKYKPNLDPSLVYTGGTLNWPCPSSYKVSSGFGPRWGRKHGGIDISCSSGSPIVSAESGVVIKTFSGCPHNYGKSSGCSCGGGFGNHVIVSHNGTLSTIYAHLTTVSVSTGQTVKRGQLVGYSGSTGRSTGPHLHFEVRVNGSSVNPTSYLS